MPQVSRKKSFSDIIQGKEVSGHKQADVVLILKEHVAGARPVSQHSL